LRNWRILKPVLLKPKRARTPAPEFDPQREWLTPYLEAPTPEAVHEILGTFILREGGWRAVHFVALGGAAVATLCGVVYLLLPTTLRFDGFTIAKALVAASPFLTLAFWLRLRRRRVRREREVNADAVAETLKEIIHRLGQVPTIDERVKREALTCARSYPRLRSVIEGIGTRSDLPLGWVLRKMGWLRRHRDG
jgi:membrane protein implicated in regulation of membrane protease activity